MDDQDYNQDHNQAPPPSQGYPQPPMPPPPRAPQPPIQPQDYVSQQGYQPQQGGYPPPPPRQPDSYPGKGMSIASLVLGICTLTISWAYGVGILSAVVGLILGITGKKKAREVGAPTGMATAGIVMCAIGIALSLLIFIACIACLGTLGIMDSGFDYWDATW